MRNDITIVSQLNPEYSKTWIVDAGTISQAKRGEPTKADDAAAASPYTGEVGIMADGDGSTGQRFTGIAKDDSTETAAAAGQVTTWLPLPGIVYRAQAKAASDANTQAKILALSGKRVVFDLTTSKWTVDAAAADAVANCVVIIGGDYHTSELDFVYAPHGTVLDFAISA